MRDDLKKNMKKDFDIASERMRNVDFQVDTLTNSSSSGAYYTSSSNSITIGHFLDDESKTEWSSTKGTLIHEQKHRDNNSQGMYAYAISKEQAYKVCMHDEISANIAELIYWRDEYIKTGDIAVLENRRCNSLFGFYTDAVKRGEINPFSNSKEDFDKEMSLIANGTRDMWERNYASTQYLEAHISNARYYGEQNDKNAEFYDQNYERAKKIAYNIGGVDFTEYMDKEVEIPDAAKMRVVPAEQLISQMNLPKYDGKMSLLQYQKLLQHALLMKDKNVGINSKDFFPGGVESCGKFNLDMAAYCYLTDGKLSDITQEMYGDALNNLSDKDALNCINGIINNIAKDYEERGELLPKGDDKAYNDAVDKLYTGKVKFNQDDLKYEGEINLRKAFNPNDELPLNELPNVAQKCQQKLEDMGGWERGLKQYASFFGEDVNLEKMSNLPSVVRYPVEALGVYVGAPVVAGGKKIIEYGKAGVDSVKEWFGEKKENIPVRPVKANRKPEYEEWSKERRVSPVQNEQILNLMANVIEKPTNRDKPDELIGRKDREILKKDMQNEALEKARMLKVIEGMNRINGAKNAMEAGRTINTLYDKFGDNAYKLLEKAVNEPFNFAQDIGDSTIRTSRDAVRSLCNIDDKNKNAVINSVLRARER